MLKRLILSLATLAAVAGAGSAIGIFLFPIDDATTLSCAGTLAGGTEVEVRTTATQARITFTNGAGVGYQCVVRGLPRGEAASTCSTLGRPIPLHAPSRAYRLDDHTVQAAVDGRYRLIASLRSPTQLFVDLGPLDQHRLETGGAPLTCTAAR